MAKNLKLLADVSTGNPIIVFVPWKQWLFAFTRGTNVKAYIHGEFYWVNRWNAKRI